MTALFFVLFMSSFSHMQLICLYPGLTSYTCGHGLFSLLTFSRSASRIPSTSLFLILFFFMGDICPPGCCPLFHFLSHSATKCISIPRPYFFVSTMPDYSTAILIMSGRDEAMRGLFLPSMVHFILSSSSFRVVPFQPP